MELPPLAVFPHAAMQGQISAAAWAVAVDSWTSLVSAYLSLPDKTFAAALETGSIDQFLVSYVCNTAASFSKPDPTLKKKVFMLAARALTRKSPPPPASLLHWQFLADFSKIYGHRRSAAILNGDHKAHCLASVAVEAAEVSLSTLKKFLIRNMEQKLNGDLKAVEQSLQRLNFLIVAWPEAGALLMAGSDFIDALVSCYTVMNPPLRRTIITTCYVSLLALTEPPTPRFSLLSDVLYVLREAAAAHKASPLRVNDSLVAELVTVTPITRQIKKRTEMAGTAMTRILPILRDMDALKKAGGGSMAVPQHRIRVHSTRIKGKQPEAIPLQAVQHANLEPSTQELHPHKMVQITQIRDLFPDLGSGFVAKLLDAFNDDPEHVIASLLEENLPPHLATADRTEQLGAALPVHMEPCATPPLPETRAPGDVTMQSELSIRKSVFDGDDFDNFTNNANTAPKRVNIHFGKHASARTADDVLRERGDVEPRKAAIMSALAAFDADDDERDDTYDAVDIGGAVEDDVETESDINDRILYAVYLRTPEVFARDSLTRRSDGRASLRKETNMTDEALEGWAVMLERNPAARRRLDARMAESGGVAGFTGQQNVLTRTSWRGNGEDGESGDTGSNRGRGGFRGRGHGRGGGASRGSVAGPTGDHETEQARRRKEASKGSRANHNRRDGRARKMARGM